MSVFPGGEATNAKGFLKKAKGFDSADGSKRSEETAKAMIDQMQSRRARIRSWTVHQVCALRKKVGDRVGNRTFYTGWASSTTRELHGAVGEPNEQIAVTVSPDARAFNERGKSELYFTCSVPNARLKDQMNMAPIHVTMEDDWQPKWKEMNRIKVLLPVARAMSAKLGCTNHPKLPLNPNFKVIDPEKKPDPKASWASGYWIH
ncbi:hypothetical protein GTW98_13090 [Streptomyces sp. SID8375]|uniref:hypothetical protein n=1 Tax=unclassified Streptomyces TaxID=2593676 RepID=UPI0011DF3FB5|nr:MULTISPECIES: hypothetical protein [unclassified Streptomyces]MYX07729.1 hypothetical protein [Streptomyces sp. SID8375]